MGSLRHGSKQLNKDIVIMLKDTTEKIYGGVYGITEAR